jgi:3-isopropylmalate dehydrogenase
MLVRYSFDLNEEADAIDNAVVKALEDGLRTGDIARKGEPTVGTREMGEAIRERIAG